MSNILSSTPTTYRPEDFGILFAPIGGEVENEKGYSMKKQTSNGSKGADDEHQQNRIGGGEIMLTYTKLLKTVMAVIGLLLSLSGCHQLQEPATGIDAPEISPKRGQEVAPIRALYITDYSAFWHDYQRQQASLQAGISRFVNVEFSVVGKDPLDALRLMSEPNFSAGYDVIIYNMCFKDDLDLERIDNIISQTRDLGVPAVLIHCAMHSFQGTSENRPQNAQALRVAEANWAAMYPERDFPYWWQFTGIDTTEKNQTRSMHAERVEQTHPITTWLPEQIVSNRDQLYRNLEVKEGVTPLYTAYDQRARRHHVVAWTHQVGAGRVFATTLGHDDNTTALWSYHHLIANGIAYVTGKLEDNGIPTMGYGGTTAVGNYQGTVTCQPSDVIEATGINDIQNAVRRASIEKKSLKVVSLPKSNSNSGIICPEQGGILLNLWQMNRVLSLDPDKETVTVQPGIRTVELSQYLHEAGFALRAMPDYTGVSIAGGIATGAHHSSLQLPSSMADMVKSMKLIDGQGRLRTFTGNEVSKVAVHLGMLGIVVEVTLSIEPQFKLKYGHQKGDDHGLEDRIEAMVADHEYARVMWFAGNGRYVLDHYNRVDNDTPGTSRHNLWSSTGSIFRWVGDIPYRILNEAPLRAQCDSALIRSRVWLSPIQTIGSSGDSPVGWSHEMLGSYCERGTCPWDNPAVQSRTMEAAFPLRRIKEWMKDVRQIIAANRACFPILGIYLRFSKGSDRWMGFNYGEDMVAFEIHVPKVTSETYFERSAAVYDEILQMTVNKYDGRPHWGKNSSPMFVDLGSEQYPKWRDFSRLRRTLDPAGRFTNKLWRLMNGEAEIKPYPGCALARDCICQEDSHCGAGYRCVAGGAYREARVCR